MSLRTKRECSEHHLGDGRFAKLGTALKPVSKRSARQAGASSPIAVSSEKPVRDRQASESNHRVFCTAKDRYPAFRVDITELFSRWLVGADIASTG